MKRTADKAGKAVLSVAIALVLNAAIFSVAAYGIRAAWNHGENNLSRVMGTYRETVAGTCEPRPLDVTRKDRLVVFRIDDAQPFLWTGIVERMVADATARDGRVVLGVIPKDILQDSVFSRYLRMRSCEFEIAQHGYSHRHDGNYDQPEFDGISEADAAERIAKGRDILETLSDEPITSFIPPQNTISENLDHLFDASGFEVISGYATEEFDAVVSTYDFGTHALIPPADVLRACDGKFEAGRTCIVMLHPQDYATDDRLDETKYRAYLELLDGLGARGAKVVTFRELLGILGR